MARIKILGVPIDALTAAEAVAALRNFLKDSGQHHVMTPNNEMLVLAAHDPDFRTLLQSTALNLPDSTGLLLAARMTGQRLPTRVPGVDAMIGLCKTLDASQPVFLLGAAPGIAEQAAAALQEKNPQLNVAGTFAGSPNAGDASAIIQLINQRKPQVLFVAYGAPKQDQWIAVHLKEFPSVRLAMGVGGSFDFLAGTIRRAPRFIRAIGLEWAWRFAQEPSRWKRMWRAVLVFPILVMKYGKEAPVMKV